MCAMNVRLWNVGPTSNRYSVTAHGKAHSPDDSAISTELATSKGARQHPSKSKSSARKRCRRRSTSPASSSTSSSSDSSSSSSSSESSSSESSDSDARRKKRKSKSKWYKRHHHSKSRDHSSLNASRGKAQREGQTPTSCTTPLSGLVEMALFSSSAACFSSSGVSDAQCLLTSDSSRSIAAGLTCVGSKGPSFEQQGQLTAPDAAIHSVRHLVHTSALHINSSGCERTLAHIAHFSSSKIDRLFTLAKGGLGSCKKAAGKAIF
eukprot:Em0001g3035a